jgi:hypothetical protein
MALEGRLAALERLSQRERTMVFALIGGALALLLVVATVWVNSVLGEVEEEIVFQEEMFVDIREAASKWGIVKSDMDALESRIRSNDIQSLRIPVNNIARGVVLESGKKLADELGSLDKQNETPVRGFSFGVHRDKKARRGEEEADVVRIDQEFQFRNIPISALYDFLDGLDAEELLFVTNLEIKRKFGGDFDRAQMAQVTVTTFRAAQEAE